MKAKKITFTGHVQAVSFRWHCERIIQNFPLTGYVKNLPNETGAPYSGDKVELFLQGEPADISQVTKLVSAYFGTKHIKNVTVQAAKIDKKYKTFDIDRSNEKGFYAANSYTFQTGFGFGYKQPDTKYNPGNSIPIKGVSSIEKKCSVCNYLTGRTCPDCGAPLCGICSENKKFDTIGKHVCKSLKVNGKFPAISPDNKMLECVECGKIITTGRCTECNEPVCNKCKSDKNHCCKKAGNSRFEERTAIYLCSVCKKARTSFQCNDCKRAVCTDCQGNHDCKKKAIITHAPVKIDYENVGKCTVCGLNTTRICKDCGKALCSICEDTTIDNRGNRLHDCQNKNEKKKSGGFIKSIRAALWI